MSKISFKLNTRRNIIGYFFILPALLIFAIFVLIPLVNSVRISFFKTDKFFNSMQYYGLWNYKNLLEDTTFKQSLKNIVFYTLMAVPLNVILSLGMAMLLNAKRKGVKAFRVLFYLPSVTSAVAASLVWMWLMKTPGGLLNEILGIFGLPESPWLSKSNTALFSITIITVWQGLGANMLIFLAALQALPHDVYEAARIDGAGPIRCFFSLTVKFLAPTMYFILTMTLIGAFQLYDQVKVLTDGGPAGSTITPVYLIWQNAFGNIKDGAGMAAAQSVILFVLIMLVTVVVRIGTHFVNKEA